MHINIAAEGKCPFDWVLAAPNNVNLANLDCYGLSCSRADEDVGQLEVTVHLPQLVAEVHCNGQLLEHRSSLCRVQLATLLLQQLVKAHPCGRAAEASREMKMECVLS